MAKKKEPEKTVRFEMHKPFVPSDEGDWFQVQVYSKDEGPYRILLRSGLAWRNFGEAARTESELATTIREAKEIYAQVRVMHTVRYAHGV